MSERDLREKSLTDEELAKFQFLFQKLRNEYVEEVQRIGETRSTEHGVMFNFTDFLAGALLIWQIADMWGEAPVKLVFPMITSRNPFGETYEAEDFLDELEKYGDYAYIEDVISELRRNVTAKGFVIGDYAVAFCTLDDSSLPL